MFIKLKLRNIKSWSKFFLLIKLITKGKVKKELA